MRSRYLLPLFFCATCFIGCGHVHHVQKANERVEKRAIEKANGNFANLSPQEYVEQYRDIAIREMKRYDIPASITLAQGLLESANGNSPLARYANNHFGIKCTPDWDGGKYYKDDDRRNDCFRVYKDADESFEDHSKFLQRPRYSALYRLKTTDYRGWARGLREAGYATNPQYPQLLINLIERYELYQYDSKESRRRKGHEEETEKSIAQQEKTIYIVKRGDTLFSIAKANGITVEDIRRINNLQNTTIEIGQRLNLR